MQRCRIARLDCQRGRGAPAHGRCARLGAGVLRAWCVPGAGFVRGLSDRRLVAKRASCVRYASCWTMIGVLRARVTGLNLRHAPSPVPLKA